MTTHHVFCHDNIHLGPQLVHYHTTEPIFHLFFHQEIYQVIYTPSFRGKRGYKLLGRFLDGKRDGKWVQWYDNGQVEVQGEYYRGKKHGEWSLWYNNGEAKEQGTFSFGKVDSLYKYWFDNGHLKEEQRYKKGLAHGRWTNWSIYHELILFCIVALL